MLLLQIFASAFKFQNLLYLSSHEDEEISILHPVKKGSGNVNLAPSIRYLLPKYLGRVKMKLTLFLLYPFHIIKTLFL